MVDDEAKKTFLKLKNIRNDQFLEQLKIGFVNVKSKSKCIFRLAFFDFKSVARFVLLCHVNVIFIQFFKYPPNIVYFLLKTSFF